MGSDLYQHSSVKFSDAGLQLRVPVDMVPANQYSQLFNAVPIIEGRLETRGSLKWIAKVANIANSGSGCHSLTRLNQPSVSGLGDRIAGMDTTVQTFVLPAGNIATSRDTSRTGDPLSLPTFHFANDTAAWQIISDRSGMKKYRGGAGAGYYQNLGILAPLFIQSNAAFGQATGNVGAAGNPNSTGGPGYDWVYTYVNTTVLSESNPSPAAFTATNANQFQTPGAVTSPDPSFGGVAGTAPTPISVTLNSSSATEARQSALFTTVPSSVAAQQIILQIVGTLTITQGNLGGCCYAAIYMTLDGGTTWKVILDSSVSRDFSAIGKTLIVNIPVSQDLSRVQIRATVFSVGNTIVAPNITARRIRDRGGNFNITDLLTGGGGNTTVALAITGIGFLVIAQTTTITTLVLTNQQGVICVNTPTDPQVDAIRLYRRGGSVTAGWAFVGQFTVASLVAGACGAGFLTITDNVADSNLGQFVSLNNDAPVTSVYVQQRALPYVWGPGLNPSRLFGCGDPDRPDAVYFSNPGNADQWASFNWIDVSSPSDQMQNGCVFNTRIFAFSKERMFELVSALIGGATLTPFQTPCSRGLISPYGLVATARAIFFVAKDGVYVTTGGEEQSLVESNIKPIFPTLDQPGRAISFSSGLGTDAVNMERIEDIRLRFHNDELWFIYRGLNTGTLQQLIFDTMKQRWRAAGYSLSTSICTVYSEEGTQSSLLLGAQSGDFFTTQTGGADANTNGAGVTQINVQVQTGAYDQGIPLTHKEYGGVVFDIDPGGATNLNPITIIPLINGEAITESSLVITGTGRQQIPMNFVTGGGQPLDIIGYNIEFFITWQVTNPNLAHPVLYQFDLLWRPEPTPLIHWEVRETSHGLPGYQHIRDMYIAIRSNANVTLTMTFDNNYTQTYTIASTTGKRSKIYVPFISNKFKLVRYSFDSADSVTPFKIYIEDSEVRVKPWLTNLGYQIAKPFGAEATLTTAAFESKLLEGRM